MQRAGASPKGIFLRTPDPAIDAVVGESGLVKLGNRTRQHQERSDAFRRFRALAEEVLSLSRELAAQKGHDPELSAKLNEVRKAMQAALGRYKMLAGIDDE